MIYCERDIMSVILQAMYFLLETTVQTLLANIESMENNPCRLGKGMKYESNNNYQNNERH